MSEQVSTPPGDWLAAFDLPYSWAGQAHFTLLDAGHCGWLNFLTLWHTWRTDPQRPRLLHHVAMTAQLLPMVWPPTTDPALRPLAGQLQAALWGLLPGFHRLAFDHGHVLLTVCVGNVQTLLRQHTVAADAVLLDFQAADAPTSVYAFKALATCCRPGTRLAAPSMPPAAVKHLTQCGFSTHYHTPIWRGEFNPSWRLRHPANTPAFQTGTCTVVGAGLAGAAVASSMARRGWRVTVLDAAASPASGASGLPAGILAPHVSPDDSLLSQLSRAGVRMTWQQAADLLFEGQDWSPTGVLERCLDHPRRLPAAWQADGSLASIAQDWVRSANDAQRTACGLQANDDGEALWHARAGWVKPAQLVQAWLRTPGVQWRGQSTVGRLQRVGSVWQVLGDSGEPLASSDVVVLAAGYATAALVAPLAPNRLALQAIRGQVSWAPHAPGMATACPVFPVNGHGYLLANLPLDAIGHRPAWLIGASFERDNTSITPRASDDQHNLQRLHTLLPLCAQTLTQTPPALRAWTGVRCATPTRLPSVGAVADADGLWLCTGLGSRGLTFAALCAELLAAQLHGEPWPLEQRLARALQPAFQAL